MKPKRPRINNARNVLERSQNNVIENVSADKVRSSQDNIMFESKMPGSEMNEELLKDAFDPISMIDYHLDADAKKSNPANVWNESTTSIKEIYNTIDFDHSF